MRSSERARGAGRGGLVAAIDIGSNSIRMVVAQLLPGGEIEVLERLQRAARLGQDTFRRGRLGGQTMRAAVSILRDYRRLLDFYEVKQVRAVATSAVREAGNSDTFIDRVFMATGIDVEVIETSEESRLIVSAVRRALRDVKGISRGHTLIADVGGGSTLLTVLVDGEIAASQSLMLGSVRLQEMLAGGGEPPARVAEMLRGHVANTIAALQGTLPLNEIQILVAIGGDARFAADQVGTATASPDLFAISRAACDALIKSCEGSTAEELAKRHGLSFAEAETIVAALIVHQTVMRASLAREMLVSVVSMRDGLLLDLARGAGPEDEAVTKGVIHSATAIGEKYHADIAHAEHVAELSLRLFDELKSEHGLEPRHRMLLRVAGLLHEVGGYVSSRAHHKHSHYLIANSEIFGLTREETNLVALVARYHRRSPPRASHFEYMALPRELRMVVSKLAALLRVADALDRSHAQHVRDLSFMRQGEDFIIYVHGVPDLTLERRAVASKGDLFEDIYGLRCRVEEAQLPLVTGGRVEAPR